MPQHVQFKKSLRKNAKARLRNSDTDSRMKTFIKKVKLAQSKEEAQNALKYAVSIIDLTARKGVIKKTTAARKKSRLSKFVSNMK